MNTHFFILLLLVAIQVRATDEADYKGHLLTFTKLLDSGKMIKDDDGRHLGWVVETEETEEEPVL